jgi:osmotically inducible lipoprotein OsmB
MDVHPSLGALQATVCCLSHFSEKFVMKMNTRLFAYVPALALVSVLGACAGMTQQEKGTATGAAVGGAAGAILGGGVLGTAAGAAVGGVVGHEVTKPK